MRKKQVFKKILISKSPEGEMTTVHIFHTHISSDCNQLYPETMREIAQKKSLNKAHVLSSTRGVKITPKPIFK